MKRLRLSTTERVRCFDDAGGRCHICGEKIDAPRDAWEISHPIPLAAGGEDVRSNRAPAHKKCHAAQTAEIDQPLIAKVKRVRARHIGARAPSPRGLRKPPGTQYDWKR